MRAKEMFKKEFSDVYDDIEKIIEHYGEEHQIKKAMEELIELHTELRLEQQGYKNSIKDEIADVVLMIIQTLMILDFEIDEIYGLIRYKIKRQLKRMEEENGRKISNEVWHIEFFFFIEKWNTGNIRLLQIASGITINIKR